MYKATVRHEKEEKSYYGLAGGAFKDRYRNHVKSFKHEKYKNETQLSKYIWELKKTNNEYKLTWDIVKKVELKHKEKWPVQSLLGGKIHDN